MSYRLLSTVCLYFVGWLYAVFFSFVCCLLPLIYTSSLSAIHSVSSMLSFLFLYCTFFVVCLFTVSLLSLWIYVYLSSACLLALMSTPCLSGICFALCRQSVCCPSVLYTSFCCISLCILSVYYLLSLVCKFAPYSHFVDCLSANSCCCLSVYYLLHVCNYIQQVHSHQGSTNRTYTFYIFISFCSALSNNYIVFKKLYYYHINII